MMDDIDRKTYFSLTMRRDGKSVNVDFDGEDITVGQMLEEVLHFMKACGYCFNMDDYLDIVNDSESQELNIHDSLNGLSEDDFDPHNYTLSDWPTPSSPKIKPEG